MGRGRNTFTGNESTLTVHALCTMIQTVIGRSSPKSELCWSGQTITLTACFHSFFLLLKNIMHFSDTSIICKKTLEPSQRSATTGYIQNGSCNEPPLTKNVAVSLRIHAHSAFLRWSRAFAADCVTNRNTSHG